MKNLTKPTLIFISAERSTQHPTVNAQDTKALQGQLDKMGAEYETVIGCYEGTMERSFVVADYSNGDSIPTMLELAGLFKQDCILVVCPSNDSYFINPETGDETSAGVFTERESKPEGDYSKIGDRFFVLESY